MGLVLADRTRLDELFDCYFSNDPVVRLRTSSAMKRVTVAQPDWVVENTTIDTLGRWAADNKNLREWLLPRLAKYVGSPRKSVAARARRMRAALS